MTNCFLPNFNSIKKIHFIGIGGISMSGLAEIMMNMGYQISGSDLNCTPITQKLSSVGMQIYYSHDSSNVIGADLVIYTAAIKPNNPEFEEAIRLKIPMLERASMLGELTKLYKNSIAISGTHGKTTTTSMISLVLLEAEKNPTIHIGGVLDAIGGNTKIGSQDYFVYEACEYVASFLKFHPTLGIILNIEEDHLDYYKDLEHIKQTFSEFIDKIPGNGHLIVNYDNENIKSILNSVKCNIISYGVNDSNAEFSARNIIFDDQGCASYNLIHNKKILCKIKLGVPGIHNVSNSLAAIATGITLGCSINAIKNALKKFTGTHRRFELKGIVNNVKVIDDYAHHPTEIIATLKAAKNCSYGKLWCIFQPHTYTRTISLIDNFSQAFTLADHVIITDIYAAREKDTGIINSQTLTEKINSVYSNAIYIKDFQSIVAFLESKAQPGDLILTMGAGNIYEVGELFLKIKEKMAVG